MWRRLWSLALCLLAGCPAGRARSLAFVDITSYGITEGGPKWDLQLHGGSEFDAAVLSLGYSVRASLRNRDSSRRSKDSASSVHSTMRLNNHNMGGLILYEGCGEDGVRQVSVYLQNGFEEGQYSSKQDDAYLYELVPDRGDAVALVAIPDPATYEHCLQLLQQPRKPEADLRGVLRTMLKDPRCQAGINFVLATIAPVGPRNWQETEDSLNQPPLPVPIPPFPMAPHPDPVYGLHQRIFSSPIFPGYPCPRAGLFAKTRSTAAGEAEATTITLGNRKGTIATTVELALDGAGMPHIAATLDSATAVFIVDNNSPPFLIRPGDDPRPVHWGFLLIMAHDELGSLHRAKECAWTLGVLYRYLGGAWINLASLFNFLMMSTPERCANLDVFIARGGGQWSTEEWARAHLDDFASLLAHNTLERLRDLLFSGFTSNSQKWVKRAAAKNRWLSAQDDVGGESADELAPPYSGEHERGKALDDPTAPQHSTARRGRGGQGKRRHHGNSRGHRPSNNLQQ